MCPHLAVALQAHPSTGQQLDSVLIAGCAHRFATRPAAPSRHFALRLSCLDIPRMSSLLYRCPHLVYPLWSYCPAVTWLRCCAVGRGGAVAMFDADPESVATRAPRPRRCRWQPRWVYRWVRRCLVRCGIRCCGCRIRMGSAVAAGRTEFQSATVRSMLGGNSCAAHRGFSSITSVAAPASHRPAARRSPSAGAALWSCGAPGAARPSTAYRGDGYRFARCLVDQRHASQLAARTRRS